MDWFSPWSGTLNTGFPHQHFAVIHRFHPDVLLVVWKRLLLLLGKTYKISLH
jgi:hypothetical protein